MTHEERNTDKSWLECCPCGDGNFKTHLKTASVNDIAILIDDLPEKGNKSKISVLKRELRTRYYEVNTISSNGFCIDTSNTFRDYYLAENFYNNLNEQKEFLEVDKDGKPIEILTSHSKEKQK